MLELAGLGIAIAGNRPIAGLALTLPDGAALAIVGRANSGKSVLAEAIAGLLPIGASIEGAGLPAKGAGFVGPDADPADLARRLDRGVTLLVCDEPGRALGPLAQRELLTALLEANRDRRTTLLIFTRDFRLPLAMGLEVAILSDGKLVERGPAVALQERPQHAATRELVAAGRPRTRTMARPPVGEPLLELQDVGRRFVDPAFRIWRRRPPFAALENITLSVRRGEAVGLLGAAGAGKTQLLRLVAGAGRASTGKLAFDRTSYRGDDLAREAQARIGLVFPNPRAAFNPALPVGLSLTEPLRVEEQLLIDEQADRLVEAVRVVGLTPDLLDHLPGQFSVAELQRLALARALVGRPSLIVLDEPTARLDPAESAEFLILFNRVRSDYGLAVLCASRDFDVLRLVADRVLVLDAGRLVESGKPSELAETGRHPATLALLAARYPEPLPATPPAPVSAPATVLEHGSDEGAEGRQVEIPVADGSGDRAGRVDALDPDPVGQGNGDRAASHVEGTQ